MKLSDQALGSMMLALQKGLMEQMDVTELLREFTFTLSDEEELVILNPPVINVGEFAEASEEQVEASE